MKKILLLFLLSFAFTVSAQKFKCNKIEKNNFGSSSISYNISSDFGISLTKIVRGKRIHFVLRVSIIAKASRPNPNYKGVVLFFENGKKIEHPNFTIYVKSSENSTSSDVKYIYSTYFNLTKSDVDLISESNITGVQLYTHKRDYRKSEKTYRLKKYMKCLISKQ